MTKKQKVIEKNVVEKNVIEKNVVEKKAIETMFIILVFFVAFCGSQQNDSNHGSNQVSSQDTQNTTSKPSINSINSINHEKPSTIGTSMGTSNDTTRGNVKRDTQPEVDASVYQNILQANHAFTVDLYKILYQSSEQTSEKNLMFSPISIQMVLAMLCAGAQGETLSQMLHVLHFPGDSSKIHPAFNQLETTLKSRGSDIDPRMGQPFQLSLVNDIWIQQDHTFLSEFLNTISQHYGDSIHSMEFIQSPDSERLRINEYISEHTGERIPNLLAPNHVTQSTRLIATNAVYFNAGWDEPFSVGSTQNTAFHLLGNQIIEVPMMFHQKNYRYLRSENFQLVCLPYVGNEISMCIVLPDLGSFEQIANQMDADFLQASISQSTYQKIHLGLPKWDFDAAFSLKGMLIELGMEQAFHSGLADFSGIDGSRNLVLDEVVHKTFIKVDEAGTEAAAATAATMRATSARHPQEPLHLLIDRPFLFAIIDNDTQTVLFFGQVINPLE